MSTTPTILRHRPNVRRGRCVETLVDATRIRPVVTARVIAGSGSRFRQFFLHGGFSPTELVRRATVAGDETAATLATSRPGTALGVAWYPLDSTYGILSGRRRNRRRECLDRPHEQKARISAARCQVRTYLLDEAIRAVLPDLLLATAAYQRRRCSASRSSCSRSRRSASAARRSRSCSRSPSRDPSVHRPTSL